MGCYTLVPCFNSDSATLMLQYIGSFWKGEVLLNSNMSGSLLIYLESITKVHLQLSLNLFLMLRVCDALAVNGSLGDGCWQMQLWHVLAGAALVQMRGDGGRAFCPKHLFHFSLWMQTENGKLFQWFATSGITCQINTMFILCMNSQMYVFLCTYNTV